MSSTNFKRLRLGLALVLAGTALAAVPAAAQVQQYGAYREDAGTALTRHLRTLSEQPRSLSALAGAGRAALELGDPQAALTFFARAEEVAPRDGRVKAGMGSAFLAMEQPLTAMRLFAEAASLGVPEAEFAGDRGLVHDLNGDPQRAQADYSLSLSRQEDDEVRRRLALSQAISGQRDRALNTIEPQLRRQDRAAWRTRAFILALAGDERGATRAAEATIPLQAAQLQPFFARLSSLSPAQRAMAVHFGHFPGDGQPAQPSGTQYASAAPVVSTPPAPTQAGRPDGRQPAFGTRRGSGARTETFPAPSPARTYAGARQSNRRDNGESTRRRDRSDDRLSPSERGQFGRQQDASITSRGAAPAPGPAARPSLGNVAQNLPTNTPPVARQTQPARQPQAQAVELAQVQARPAPTAQPSVTTAVPPPSVTELPPSSAAQQSMSSFRLVPSTTAPPTQPPSATAQQSLNISVRPPAVTELPPSAAAQPPIAATALAPSSAAPASQTPPATEPAQQSLAIAQPQQPPAATIAKESAADSFADIAAAIAALPGEPAPSASTPKPEPQLLARLDPPKAAAPAKPKPEAPKAKETAAKDPAADKAGSKKEPAAKKEASAKKDAASKKEAAAKKEPAAPKEASRHWVQIAGGANEAAMNSEFKRLKAKAPKLLGSRTAWTTPLKATNRLLVGPFKTSKEAQDFVNELAKLDLSAFSWTSPAGQEIAKLSAK